jgi:SSS family transporter
MKHLEPVDYLVIGLYLAGVVTLGLILSGKQKSLEDYFLAGRRMPWWVVSISTYATEMSAITFLGGASWIYQKDSRNVILPSLAIIVLSPLSALIWTPIWSRLRMLSIFEYLEYRYHPAVRAFCAGLFPLNMIFWIGPALVASSKAFSVVTGVPPAPCLMGIVVLGGLYTVIGGARAVMWTDVVQFFVFMGSFIVILCILLNHYDWRPMEIHRIASSVVSDETGYPATALISTEFSLAVEATVWVLIVQRVLGVFAYGTNQTTMQRLMAADTRRSMFKAVLGQGGINIAVALLTSAAAWGFVAFYHQNPEAATFNEPDEIVTHFTANFMPVAIRGLMLAGLLAAMMSTFDSVINSMGSVMINDFYRRYFATGRTSEHYLGASRIVGVAAGIILLLFALWQLKHGTGVVSEQAGRLMSLVSGPPAIFFIMGIFFRRANTGGVLVGGVVSMVLSILLLGFSGLFGPIIPGVNWMWANPLATIAGILVAIVASRLFRAPSDSNLEGLTLFRRAYEKRDKAR